MAKDCSFDVVSEVDMQEVDNAVNQAKKEIGTRYDFRGSKAEFKLEGDTIKKGITKENAKEVVKAIKNMKLKVQASIQADQVRESGKDKDDLQAVIQMLKQLDVPVELQFVNFRS